MRKLIVAAIAALTLGMATSAMAQVTGTTASSAGAQAIANPGSIGTINMPGAGNTAPNFGTLNTNASGTVWTLGQTASIATTSYDACLKNFSVVGLFVGLGIPFEISHCWELRDMDAMAKYPPGSVQYEHGCRDSSWLNTDWVSGQMKCTANQAKLRKTNPNDSRVQPFVAVPVASTNMGGNNMQGPPPTVVPVSKTNQLSEAPVVASVDYSRRCNPKAGIVEQCTQF